jgi:hypothetical protein
VSLNYGFAKATVISKPRLQSKRLPSEIQYHLHVTLLVGQDNWDVAINVGTSDADDLLKYKLVYDFHHAQLIGQLGAAAAGYTDLTSADELPALDFQRSDVLADTGPWRDSDVMDGSEQPEPIASLQRLLVNAQQQQWPVYLFGRLYAEGNGIHDIHMNQGSTGRFLHRPDDDSNDHNDVWQDGAVLVQQPQDTWAAYVAGFTQQLVPTDGLGNPLPDAKPLGNN